jgi:RNA polymerase sigma factor (sigma-70 family)
MRVVGARTGPPDYEACVDDEATSEFVRIYMKELPFTSRLAYAAVPMRYVEDIVHDVFLALLAVLREDPRQFAEEKSIRNWLATAIRNRAANFHKERRRRELRDADWVYMAQDDLVTRMESTIVADASVDAYEKAAALAKLTEVRKECWLMKHRDGLSVKEIAAKRGIAPKTAGTHITYANKAIVEALGGSRKEAT